MNNKHRYQCQVCGNLQWSEIPFYIEDELFTNLKCGHCKRETNHLYVGGDDGLDLYEMYNINVDPKYYQYNTKQND